MTPGGRGAAWGPRGRMTPGLAAHLGGCLAGAGEEQVLAIAEAAGRAVVRQRPRHPRQRLLRVTEYIFNVM